MSVVEAIARAQQAQREHDRRIPVQMSMDDIAALQTRLLDSEPCSECEREDVVLVWYMERWICVDCITKMNGEDGDG